ncbi:MAG: aminoglycoside phosphotransferase family protein [Clostridia bacterium]|nr:aminoglycoside phosphotransferase family protein [Clostridia bacterium]
MRKQFIELAHIFQIPGEIRSIDVISNGNINTTYDVTICDGGTDRRYVFQKVNIFVFKNPKRIMKNIEMITTHVANKLEAEGKSRDLVMHFAHTAAGKNYYMEDQGFWRVSEYVPNTVTYNSCEDLERLKSAGRAFGNFQTMLSDFDASSLYETIPNFHNTRSRIAVLLRHVNEDPCGRVDEVGEEIERIRSMKHLACRLNELLDSQELPLRVTHNDTKINNVLFDRDGGEAKTVIDLDTVMPGLVAHDFGDAVRFAANTSAEDEPDLSKVSLDMNRFRAFAEGFIPEVANSLTPMEVKTLSLGAFTMTLELAVRFLDDYITGDQYFKTLYRGHNLVRTRCQLKLAEDMFEHLGEMNKVVADISGIPF